MQKDETYPAQNKITLEGMTYKTSGNIVFGDCEESPFHLAQSALLDKMDGILEHGMQTLLKKIKT